MREILFKAKRIDNGEWVEGQYCYMLNPKSENGEPKKHFICNGTNVFNYEIDPETLCQYTGLTDKNGKLICENDIVKTQHFTDRPYSKYAKEKQFNGYVYWKERKFDGNKKYKEQIYAGEWDVKIIQDVGNFICGSWGRLWDCEVIGNIFDNPELLEEKQ